MTVFELLERIAAAYPGATAEAMKSFKPVFYARLRDREGDALDTAANEVLGSFRPKATQPFPIPADFEAHLPSRSIKLPGGSPIRDQMAEAKRKRDAQLQAWREGQGAKIRASKPEPVYLACVVYAATMKPRENAMLTREEFTVCEERALSTARVRRFGPVPKSPEVWKAQIEEIRTGWYQQEEAA